MTENENKNGEPTPPAPPGGPGTPSGSGKASVPKSDKAGTAKTAKTPRKRRFLPLSVIVIMILVAGIAAGWATFPMWRAALGDRVAGWLGGEGPARIEASLTDLRQTQTDLASRLMRLENEVARLQEKVEQAPLAAAPAPSPDTIPQANTAGAGAEMGQRLAAMEAARDQANAAGARSLANVVQENQKLQAQLAALEKELETLRAGAAQASTVLSLAERVDQVEKTARAAQAERQSGQALVLAIGQLREAVKSGQAYGDELRAVKVLAKTDPELTQDLDVLTQWSQQGITTRMVLAGRFEALAGDIVKADLGPDGGGWVDETFRRMASLVSVRRIDGEEAGDTTAAIVARAESRLDMGDLASAVAQLENLQGEAAAEAQGWLTEAKARLQADQALSALTSQALAVAGSQQAR